MPEYSNSWMLHFTTLYSKYFLVLNTCLCLNTQIPGYSILLLFTRSIFWFRTPAYAWILKCLDTPFYCSLLEVFFGFEHLLMPEYSNSWILHFIALYSTYFGVSNTCLRLTIGISGYFVLFSFYFKYSWLLNVWLCLSIVETVDTGYSRLLVIFKIRIPLNM